MTAAVVYVLTLTAVGLLLTRSPGLAFLYGTGAVYVALLLLAIAGVPWSLPAIAAILVAIAAIGLWRPLRESRISNPESRTQWSAFDLLTLAALVIYARYAILYAGSHWDFWAIWGLKGRVFFDAGTIDWQFLGNRWNAFAHPDYPLHLPLNYTALALAGGGWDDRWIGILYVAFGASLLLIVRAEAARETEARAAAIVTLAAALFALSPQIGLGEGPLIAYGGAALLMIRRAIRDDDLLALRHGAILLGLAGATKNEGVTLIVAAAIALLLVTRRWRYVVRLWPAVALVAPWIILVAIHALPSDLAAAGVPQRLAMRLHELPQLATAMARSLSNRIMWALLVASLFVIPGRVLRRELFVFIALAIQLAFFTAAYLVTPHDAAWHVASSFGRISTQLGLPFVYVATVALSDLIGRHEAGSDHQGVS